MTRLPYVSAAREPDHEEQWPLLACVVHAVALAFALWALIIAAVEWVV